MQESKPKARRRRGIAGVPGREPQLQPSRPGEMPAGGEPPGIHYRAIYENAVFGIFQTTPDGRFVTANPALARIFGYESVEQLMEQVTDIGRQIHVDPERRRQFARLLQQSGEAHDFECRAYRKDGSIIWISLTAGAIRDEESRVIRFEGMIEDITRRKEAEEALRASEPQLRAVFEAAGDALVIADDQGRILQRNPAAAELLAQTRPGDAEPEGPGLDASLRQILAGGPDKGEIELQLPGGSTRVLEYTVTANFLPGRHLAVLRDITGRRHAEREIDRLFAGEQQARVEAEGARGRLTRILESIRDAFVAFDREWRITYMNQEGADLLRSVNRSPEELLGRVVWDEFPELRGTVFEQKYLAAVESQETVEFEEHAEALGKWFSFRAYPSPDGLAVYARDISDRRRAEDNLRQSEERLQAVLDNSSAVVYIKDGDGRYLLINRRHEELFHFARKDVIGKTDYDIFPKEIADAFRSNDKLVLETNQPMELEEVAPHDEGLHTYISVKFPLTDKNGSPYSICGISTDITERKQEEERMRFLAEAGALLTSSLDYETTLARVARLGLPLLADSCSVHVFPDGDKPHRAAVAHADPGLEDLMKKLHSNYPPRPEGPHPLTQLLQTAQPVIVPDLDYGLLGQVAQSDEHRQILLALNFTSYMAVPLIARGRLFGALTFAFSGGKHYNERDLELAEELARRAALAIDNARLYAESQRIQDDLRRANEAKDEFLGLVSHELRTPITSIYGGSRILRARLDQLDDESRDGLLADIEQESERLNRIIEDLLVLARMELGETLSSEPVLIGRIIERVAALFRRRRPLRQLDIMAEDIPPVEAEPTYLEQVLRNLLSNADKYSPPDASIAIHARSDASSVTVSVLDRGAGLPPEELELIFERFYRSEGTSRQAGGVGIGLTVCKRLIEAQAGQIWARGRSGGGLEVGFTLPLYREKQ